MKKNASPKRRLFIAKNLIMLIVIAVTIVLACFSWFTQNTTATANGISVTTKKEGIEIAKCIKGYDDQGTVIRDGPGEFSNTLVIDSIPPLSKDCTGDGDWYKTTVNNETVDVKTLIVPEFNVSNQSEEVKQKGKEVNLNAKAQMALSNLDAEDYHRKHPDEDVPEYQYIAVEFYVRSRSQALSVSADSKLLAKTESDGEELQHATYTLEHIDENSNTTETEPVNKQSMYGDFNVDALVGSIRVSLIAQPADNVTQTWSENVDAETGMYKVQSTNLATLGNPVKQFLWLPRPDVLLHVGDTLTDWTISTGVQSGVSYQHNYYKRNDGDTGVVYVNNDTSAIVSTINGGSVNMGQSVNVTENLVHADNTHELSSLVVSPSDKTTTDDYYVTKYTMYIWIEGTDAEARRAMDGGQFELELVFQ